jgi:hypothetical protein
VFLLRTVRHSSGTERLRATPASSVVRDERPAWAAVVAFTAVHSNNILLQWEQHGNWCRFQQTGGYH